MINSVKLNNFGPFRDLEWDSVGGINLITGANGSGKTYLLKAMYSAMRSLEEYYIRSGMYGVHEIDTIVPERLDSTFGRHKIGDLVSNNEFGLLSYSMRFDGHKFYYEFGRNATHRTSNLHNVVAPRKSKSVFLPPEEIMTLGAQIRSSPDPNKTLDIMSSFGFDDTCLDIIKALFSLSIFEKESSAFGAQRKALQSIIGGRASYNNLGHWDFFRSDIVTHGDMVSDGPKKIAAIDVLLGNNFIDEGSIIFIDEVESGLHPRLVIEVLDVILDLAKLGIQFFITSNSCIVLKKLAILAKKNNYPVYMLDLSSGPINLQDLAPNCDIVQVGVDLRNEEDLYCL